VCSGVKVFSEVLGSEIIIPERPKRIVSISPAITETIFKLGADDRLVGVSVFCDRPPEARKKPKVGSYYKVNYRLLKELDPDLVLVTTGAQRGIIKELIENGFKVYPVPLPVSVYGILENTVIVGILIGEFKKASELCKEITKKILSLRDALKGVKLYYEVDLGEPVSIGAHSYIGDAFRLLGLITPFDNERRPWIINPDPDVVRKFDPEIIVYEPKPFSKFSKEKIAEKLRKRLGPLNALENDRLLVIEPNSLAHYGPGFFDSLEDLVNKVKFLLKRN
jgi:iron complex transport system substrate-binding protein